MSSIPCENGKSCILHIRETDGKPSVLNELKLADGKHAVLKEVDVLGEEIEDGSTELRPFEIKFIKMSW